MTILSKTLTPLVAIVLVGTASVVVAQNAATGSATTDPYATTAPANDDDGDEGKWGLLGLLGLAGLMGLKRRDDDRDRVRTGSSNRS